MIKLISSLLALLSLNIYSYYLGIDEVTLTDTEVMLNASGSYFVIDNFALSLGLSYTLNSLTWMCDGSECVDGFLYDYTTGLANEEIPVLSPFGFSFGVRVVHMLT